MPPQRGRPRKYGRPARAVTVTLPDDVLDRLTAINPDIGQAIVAMTERRPAGRPQPPASSDVVAHGKDAVIVVTPVPSLRRLKGVHLVPIGEGRALLSLDPTVDVSVLELQVRDGLERGIAREPDATVLRQLADILRRARGDRRQVLTTRTIIVIGAKGGGLKD